jgi:hypothetical protein
MSQPYGDFIISEKQKPNVARDDRWEVSTLV